MTGKMKFSSPEEVIIKLKKLIKKIERLQKLTESSDISHAQLRIIFPIVKYNKGCSMNELSELVGVDKALVSRAITDLENKGIIERDKKTDKERNYKIILTSKGRHFFAEKHAAHKEILNKELGNISKEEVFHFMRVLDKLTEAPKK